MNDNLSVLLHTGGDIAAKYPNFDMNEVMELAHLQTAYNQDANVVIMKRQFRYHLTLTRDVLVGRGKGYYSWLDQVVMRDNNGKRHFVHGLTFNGSDFRVNKSGYMYERASFMIGTLELARRRNSHA